MADLHAWLETTLRRISGRSEMAEAIHYSLNHWDALTLVLRDGRACIDKSAVERAMRPVALGRNWTFAGPNAGGVRAAAFYSLIQTVKMNDAEFVDYLWRVIEGAAELLLWTINGLRARLDQRHKVKYCLHVDCIFDPGLDVKPKIQRLPHLWSVLRKERRGGGVCKRLNSSISNPISAGTNGVCVLGGRRHEKDGSAR